nr:uncharacterized protein LOC129532518 [Gorilla gorilla gorilla]
MGPGRWCQPSVEPQLLRPAPGAPSLGRSSQPRAPGRALGPGSRRRHVPRQPLAGAASACGRLPPPPLPEPTINTTFYETKTNFSDVTHLCCSRRLGRASRGPVASVVGAREPHSAAPHGHTTRSVTPGTHNTGERPRLEQQRSRGPRSCGPEREGACGRVVAVAGVRVCAPCVRVCLFCVCLCMRVCVSVCVCARAAADTGGPGLRVPAAESGGRGGGSRRTTQGTPRPAHPVPPYGRSFLDD